MKTADPTPKPGLRSADRLTLAATAPDTCYKSWRITKGDELLPNHTHRFKVM